VLGFIYFNTWRLVGSATASNLKSSESTMKKLLIHVHAELEIPDDWELAEHSGVMVLKAGDRFIDFDITPLATTSSEDDATWTDEDEEFTDAILDMVTGVDSEMEITYLQ
jgi:hypothetical protein